MDALQPALYETCRARLECLLDVAGDIDDVERTIEGYALDRENKAALWLWATARRAQPTSASVRTSVGAQVPPALAIGSGGRDEQGSGDEWFPG